MKRAAPICISGTNGIQRAEYVVVNGLARAMLHKRDVFMGSRMKHPRPGDISQTPR